MREPDVYLQLEILSVCQIKLVIINHTSHCGPVFIHGFNNAIVNDEAFSFKFVAALIFAMQI